VTLGPIAGVAARVLAVLAAVYLGLVVLMWLLQERIAFPAPREEVPEPSALGGPLRDGRRVTITTEDGVELVGWYFPPLPRPPARAPAILWLHGNAETVPGLASVVPLIRVPGSALLLIDYRGYGASGGRASERGLQRDAEAALGFLESQPEVDSARIVLYGRSLGTGIATWLAARRRVAGLILDSPFTSARDLSRRAYAWVPSWALRMRLDVEGDMASVRCPVLIFHGTDDQVVPFAMGERVARAAPQLERLIPLVGADHNETYAVGGTAYRDSIAAFVRKVAG
jgi:uncharacterized protein